MFRLAIIAVPAALALAACGSTAEERAATGGGSGIVAGALVGGPVGAAVGGAVGAAAGTALDDQAKGGLMDEQGINLSGLRRPGSGSEAADRSRRDTMGRSQATARDRAQDERARTEELNRAQTEAARSGGQPPLRRMP
ncbi:MAG TPA: YMGG-like glycine zipper-containing protein [Azospirillaceae bacterium]|nr:YMGG-like glycine zipper-containing protein [Azospirillaceae bacterium]